MQAILMQRSGKKSPSLEYCRRPQCSSLIGDPQNFIGERDFFHRRPPDFHWKLQDFHRRPQNFSLWPEMGITENTAMVVSNKKGFPTVLQWWKFLHNLILIDFVNCVENIASNNFILCFFSIHLQVIFTYKRDQK